MGEKALEQLFSTEGSFSPQRTVGHVWRHFGLSHTGRGLWCIEARDASKHPTMHSTAHDRAT